MIRFAAQYPPTAGTPGHISLPPWTSSVNTDHSTSRPSPHPTWHFPSPYYRMHVPPPAAAPHIHHSFSPESETSSSSSIEVTGSRATPFDGAHDIIRTSSNFGSERSSHPPETLETLPATSVHAGLQDVHDLEETEVTSVHNNDLTEGTARVDDMLRDDLMVHTARSPCDARLTMIQAHETIPSLLAETEHADEDLNGSESLYSNPLDTSDQSSHLSHFFLEDPASMLNSGTLPVCFQLSFR